jgi:SpoVK/Ycf46/Vps4 family AAA+-type ATPase
MIYPRRQEPLISYRIVSRPFVVAVLTVVHNLTTLAVSSDIAEVAINVRDTGENVHKLRLSHHEKEIRDWLSAADPSINYANALEKRHKGTGIWFTKGQAFADWKKQPNSFLWLHGIPGCGKTVLSSTIIEHLSNATPRDQVLLYFYFDFNDSNKQTLENMLRSLVNQLYQGQLGARGPLNQLWESTRPSNQQPSKMSLRDVLLVMLSKVTGVSIVLDALDESTIRSEVLAWMRDVLETNSCRILVTARREEDIESALQRWMRPEDSLSIQKDDVNEDIRAYVSHIVSNSDELDRWCEKSEVQDEIKTTLVRRADGM